MSTGDEVVAGTTNGFGTLTISVNAVSEESYFNRMGEILKKTDAQKSAVQSLADRFSGYLFYFVVMMAFLALIIWWGLRNLETAIPFVVSILVIACSHALGLAIPLVRARTLSLAARAGFLIQRVVPFESAHQIDTVVLDKTGTLTTGDFQVTAVETAPSSDEREVITLVYSLEYYSEHPLARGIVRCAEKQQNERLKVEDFEALPGQGMQGTINGHRIQVLSERAATQTGISLPQTLKTGATLSIVSCDQNYLGMIALMDEVISDAKETINALHREGLETVMLTGDQEIVRKWRAVSLNV